MAVTLTANELAAALLGNQTVVNLGLPESETWATTAATRLFPVVTALVDRYTPGAPDSISNEAAIRTAGWLAQQPADSRVSDSFNVLGLQGGITHNPSAVSPLRASVAMGLLTFWKVRRGGTI